MATHTIATQTGETARYNRVAMWLHWLIALAIAYNLASGLLGAVLPRGFFVFHISSGLTILILSVARVVWRLTHRPPPMLPMSKAEKGLAHLVHFALYVAILWLPFSGWAMISARPPIGSPGAAAADAERAAKAAAAGKPAPGPSRPVLFWGVVPVPMIASVNRIGATPEGLTAQRAAHEKIETFHYYGAWVLLALLVLHIGGALKHQLVDGEPELARMGLGGRRRIRTRHAA